MYKTVQDEPDLLDKTDFYERCNTSSLTARDVSFVKILPHDRIERTNGLTRIITTTTKNTLKYSYLWRKTFLRLKARRAIDKLTGDIVLYGTSPEGDKESIKSEATALLDTEHKSKIMKKLNTFLTGPSPRYFIHPDSLILELWKLILGISLSYTAIFEAYSLAFSDRDIWDAWTGIAIILDIVFFIDFVRVFFTSHKKADGTIESSFRVIIREYAMGWLLIDMFSAIPFGVIDAVEGSEIHNEQDEYSFWEMGEIPKVYMIFRLLRLLKIIKGYMTGDISYFLQNYCKLNPPQAKLALFIVTVSICIHVMACVWYFAARVQGLGDHTWVTEYGIYHKPDDTKYLCAIYWAVTTLATIGYGDIVPMNDLERCICIVWMIFGVGFYSYTIGSLSSLISSIDSQQALLDQRLYTVSEFSKEAGLDDTTKKSLLNAIRYNSSQSLMTLDEKTDLFNELPRNLRYEIASKMYQGAITKLVFFKGRDKTFIVSIIPFLSPHQFQDSHKIYKVGDFSDEMYFILSGRVMLVYGRRAFVYKSFLKGSYFGEIEIIEKCPRIDKIVTFGRCNLLVLSKDILLQQMENFPIEAESIIKIAQEKKKKNLEAKMRILDLLKSNRVDTLSKDDEILFTPRSQKQCTDTLPSTSRREII